MWSRFLVVCLSIGALCSAAPAHGAGLLSVAGEADASGEEAERPQAPTESLARIDAEEFLAAWNLAVNLQVLAEQKKMLAFDPSTALVSPYPK